MVEGLEHLFFPGLEVALEDMLSCFADEPEVEGEVVDGGDLHGEDFSADEEMPEEGFGVKSVHIGGTIFLDGREVVSPFAVADIDGALGGKEHAVASVAGWHDAIEHIDPSLDAFEDVDGGADAHEVAWAVFGEDVVDDFNHVVHNFGGFADGKTSDGVSFGLERGNVLGGLLPEVFVGAALNDGEEGLAVSVERLRLVEVFPSSLEPLLREPQGLLCVSVVAGAGGAFVECHHDVAADGSLDVDDFFGCEEVFASVDVTSEGDAFGAEFAVFGEGEDLEASAVGEDGSLPAVEFVKSSCFL